MSDSFGVLLKAAGTTVLALALCLGLILGPSGCGDGKDDPGDTTAVTTGPGDGGSATDGSGVDSQNGAIDSALLGKWYCETLGETLEFTADGQMIWTGKGKDPSTVISYSIENSEIVISIDATEGSGYLQYSVAGEVLTIEDPEKGSLTYTRAQ